MTGGVKNPVWSFGKGLALQKAKNAEILEGGGSRGFKVECSLFTVECLFSPMLGESGERLASNYLRCLR